MRLFEGIPPGPFVTVTKKVPTPSIAIPLNWVGVTVTEPEAKLQVDPGQPGPLKTTIALFGSKPVPAIVNANARPVTGGFGSAVSEMLDASGIAVPQLRLGVPNEFVLHGKRDELLKQVGLDADGIARRTLEFVRQSRHQYL